MEKKWHKLLERQLYRLLPKAQLSEATLQLLEPFFDAINAAYQGHDRDRELLERSLEFSSKEMTIMNAEVKKQNTELSALFRTMTFITAGHDIREICNLVTHEVARATEFPFVWIEFIGHGQKSAILKAATAPETLTSLVGLEYKLEPESNLGALVKGAAHFRTGDATPAVDLSEFFAQAKIASLISVPLRSSAGLVGALSVGHTNPHLCPDGIVDFLITIAGQISSELERQRTQEQSQHQQAAVIANSKMSELGKMAGGIAHEVNTPLNVMMLLVDDMIEMAQEQKLTDFAAPLDKVLATINHLASVVKGLRAFSREGSTDPFEKVALRQIVDDTLSFCRSRFAYHFVELKVECPDDLTLECRAPQVSQALLNLLTNALDAVADLPEKWVHLRVREVGDSILIEVTDGGPGIPLELHEQILTPFFTTKEPGSGTGLGLSISSGIAKAHGGRLWLDTQCTNTRFVLTLAKAQKG
jgi:signal transduction histidine kinase